MIPIDSARFALIAMSGARPAACYAEKADGTTQFVPGQQGLDRATGLPVWEIDAVAPAAGDDERGRMTTLTVKIVAQHAPDVTPAQPVQFDNLTVRPSVNRRTGQLSLYWNADGIVASRRPAAVAS